jgi:hypothetical protein
MLVCCVSSLTMISIQDILLAHLHRVCPFTLPRYIPRFQGQTDSDYLEKACYKKVGEIFESEEAYNKRMNGILAVYAAITQTKLAGVENPHGISNAWTWMARLLNMKPKKITPAILLTFLNVSAHTKNVPLQFQNVLTTIEFCFFIRLLDIVYLLCTRDSL